MSDASPTRKTTAGDYALSLLLLAFLWTGLLHVLKAPFWELTWLSVIVVAVRYGLLGLAALFVRPWPFELMMLLSVLIWAGLDLLAITGLFDVYAVLQPGGEFLHFQF